MQHDYVMTDSEFEDLLDNWEWSPTTSMPREVAERVVQKFWTFPLTTAAGRLREQLSLSLDEYYEHEIDDDLINFRVSTWDLDVLWPEWPEVEEALEGAKLF